MRILLTGGGTLGSVAPLLAVIPHLKEQKHDIHFIGTFSGPEKTLVENAGVEFHAIVAPKLRRYFSWHHLLLPIECSIALCSAFFLLLRWRPNVIVSAGGFTSVPFVWIGWLLRIPSMIHQQDLQPGLANKLMQRFATKITVAFKESVQYFSSAEATDGDESSNEKVQWIGNPIRDLTATTNDIPIDSTVPTVLIFGGGTGAQAINELVSAALCEHANVIHIIGKGRAGVMERITHHRYHQFEILHQGMAEALQKADLIVGRAGLGTISECAALGKPAIIIPMPQSHQEANATMLQQHNAALVLDQREMDTDALKGEILQLLRNQEALADLSNNITQLTSPNANELFLTCIESAASTGIRQ